MTCPSCGSENPAGFRFCGSCGAALARTCSSCGAKIPEGFRFCGACGASLEARTGAIEHAMPTERRRVVVLFADLVGFSTLAEHLDPEELSALMAETFTELTHEVEARGGIVEKFIGDAIVAIFGAPRTHEDDPDRAVRCALAMIDTVGERSKDSLHPLRLRIGINAGLVVSGTVGDGTQTGVVGDTVNTAARLQQAAEPGDVLVSASVWRRVQDRFDGDHVGELEVKGREQRVDAYRILRPRVGPRRREAAFVGRREEMALMDLLWSSASKGNTHVVSLVGEPGVGKSRLLHEFLPRNCGLEVRVSCAPERAYGSFLDLIESILGRTATDIDDLRTLCAGLGVKDEIVPLIAALLGLAGAPPAVRMADEQRRRQVFAGVWQFLVAAAKRHPALVILDDVHWADRSSVDLLGFVLERIGGVPLMIVLAHRPGFDLAERIALRASHTAIRLEPLSPEESVAVACGYLDVAELPEDLARIVASRAEGNPFFIEELLQALLELEALAVVDGAAVLAKVELEIPDTVQGTILARVDRLDSAEKRLLQQAAVIGRTFDTGLLTVVAGEDDVGGRLQGLARAQLVVAHGPDQWIFKHALIQEATYDTLLLRERKELHRSVAEALEASAMEDPATLELLAEHYALAEVREKARRYAVAAGDLAAERVGFVESRARYETALRLWGEGDEEGRLMLLMKFARSGWFCGDYASARTALVEAAEGYRAQGDTTNAGKALAMLGRIHWVAGDADRATSVLNDAIALLEPLGASEALLQAYIQSSSVAMLAGRYDQGKALALRGLELESSLGLDAARSNLLNTFGVCQISMGDPAGLENLRLAVDLAESSADPEALGRAYLNLPTELNLLGRNRESIEVSRRGQTRLRGSPTFELYVSIAEGESLMYLGRYDESEEHFREVLGPRRSETAAAAIAEAGAHLALMLTRRGRYEDARRILDETMPLQRSLGGGEYLARALTVEAELEQARGNTAAARLAIEEAAQIVSGTSDIVHAFRMLPLAARLFGDGVGALLAHVEPGLRSEVPVFEAAVLEARAILEKDPSLGRKAAEMYASLELPYECARAGLDAGDREAATKIIAELGVENGPLGARLKELAG